jgi:hypothetical protein
MCVARNTGTPARRARRAFASTTREITERGENGHRGRNGTPELGEDPLVSVDIFAAPPTAFILSGFRSGACLSRRD